MSFSPGGDSQPEITAVVAAAAGGRRAEGLPGSDLNFNTFPITAVWAGKITRGQQALFSSCFSGQLTAQLSPWGPQVRFVLSPGLQDLDKPGRHVRTPGFLGCWFSRPGNKHCPYSILWSPGDIFGNGQIVEKVLCLLGLRDQDQGLDSSGDQGSVYNQH